MKQVPTATTREDPPLVSGWPIAQQVMMGQTVDPKLGNLNKKLFAVSFIPVGHEWVV